MPRVWKTSVAVLVAALVPASGGGQQPPTPNAASQRTAVVRVELSPYDDSEDSLQQLDLVSRAIPPRRVTLAAGSTLSALVLQEYGFGLSNLPKTYHQLERRILELNGFSTADAVPAGQLLIPNLPSRVRPNPDIEANLFPAVADFRTRPRRGGAASVESVDDLVSERVQDTSRRGAGAIVVDVPLQADLLKDGNVARLLQEPFATVASAPMKVKFGQDPCKLANPAPPLSVGQAAELTTVLRTAQRFVPVFIIDSGWPNETEAGKSQAFLKATFREARKRYRLPAVNVPDIPFTPPNHKHAVEVEEALSAFRAADPANRIQTVYVPMSLDQGSAPLLRELVEVADIVRRVTNRFGHQQIPPTIPTDIREDARRHANDIVNQLPKFAGDITETDKAIVESVITLAADAARRSGTFYVVNESWSVASDVVAYVEPANPLGIVVAAVGNEGLNVIEKEIDFAQRSLNSNNFVAVMNVDSAGTPVCRSSFVAAGILEKAAVLGFSGSVSGKSATSYAAPRIAWLLAAAEASRAVAVEPSLWRLHLRDRLLQLRGSPVHLSADPVKLARLWQLK